MPAEKNGHALLLRDLLKLPRTYTYRRYRIDVLGFITAWVLVFLFVLFYWWFATWQ